MSRKGQMQKMALTVSLIQQRWGTRAIHRAADRTDHAEPLGLSTGFADVDRLLGGQGFSRGHLVELIGTGTAGQMTLAAKTLQEAQKAGQQIVYVDVFQSIDLDFLARCGVQLEPLVVLRPPSFTRAIEMTSDLIHSEGAGTIVFDRLTASLAGTRETALLERALPEWNLALSRQLQTLVIVSELVVLDAYPYGTTLPHLAFTRLLFEWQAWRYKARRVNGFTSQVTVLKNRVSSSGSSCQIEVTFHNGIHGASKT